MWGGRFQSGPDAIMEEINASIDFDRKLAALGVAPADVLVAGDELGPLGGSPGSDSLMLAGDGARATAISVGVVPQQPPISRAPRSRACAANSAK